MFDRVHPSAVAAWYEGLEERGIEPPAAWGKRLAACGTGRVFWWYRAGALLGQQRRCNLPVWCGPCERARAAKARRRMELALGGTRAVEMWTLTVPEWRQETRRAVLLRAWAKLRKRVQRGAPTPWAAGVELKGATHWHLHVVVGKGTADALGGGGGAQRKSWTRWRALWSELVYEAAVKLDTPWPESARTLEGAPWASAWVSTRRPVRTKDGAVVGQDGDEMDAKRAIAYAAKYACKPYEPDDEADQAAQGHRAAALWKRKRVIVPHGTPREQGWESVPGANLQSVEPGFYDGDEADELVRRAWTPVDGTEHETMNGWPWAPAAREAPLAVADGPPTRDTGKWRRTVKLERRKNRAKRT